MGRMRWQVFMTAMVAFLGLPETRLAAQGSGPDAYQLILRIQTLDGICRSGATPTSQKSCDEREALLSKLHTKGWCWGREDQMKWERQWEPCDGGRSPDLLTYVTGQANLQRWFAVAYVASLCRMRSDAYLRTFSEARYESMERERSLRRLSEADWARVADDMNTVYLLAEIHTGFDRSKPTTLTTACQALPNDPLLRRMDAIYDRSRGVRR